MVKLLIPFVIGVLWVLLASTLGGFLPPRIPIPDVVLVVVIIFGFQYTFPLGGGLSFVLGLVQDILSGGVIGLNALSKTVVFSLTRVLAKRFYAHHWASKVAMVFLGGLVDGLLVTVILLIGGMIHIPAVALAHRLLLHILCTGILSPLVLITVPTTPDSAQGGGEDWFFHGPQKAKTRRI